jgi:hypothetical protein
MFDKKLWISGLCEACYGGHIPAIEFMIEFTYQRSTQAEIEDPNGWNQGLFSACKGGHLEAIELMIKQGANDWNGGLKCACEYGRIPAIELMIKRGANDWNAVIDNTLVSPEIINIIKDYRDGRMIKGIRSVT